ncbi:Cbb3-type cytochrome c oxidase subunit CcoP [Roseivivax sp. THAF40]|uniref:cytochrome-c oxidase, cbb3-type subunit III n=1 Tax=unclassified Roseivivax TaxID=2639302 RepID=UPI0012684BE7|nr:MULTISPECIES: cytochrome-c oxidase, cbb3-type subunit III [unclassified Roseivivax]QFS83195.1 Cbb3-type cytochrome c oxidase subunit CcoP [Roseivivax sp. THAF197b]QFT46939.1 Cbb3-type cytochrome c oxidase subunit CcoP [Roseivivax sp. THAF40]
MTEKKHDDVTGTETTGHSWDGIEELNTPLPRWWLWTFYATIVWGVIYTILYPAWPLVSSASAGILGWSTRGEVAQQISEAEAANAGLRAQLIETELAAVSEDPALQNYAVQHGAAVFRTNCSQCHGQGAAGGKGYPNLLDDAWLWGGQIEEIAYTVRHGIRNEDDPDARYSQMPAYGDIFSDEEIDLIVAHVATLDDGADPMAGPAGELWANNCAACHGEDGKGNHDLGAPNLTDAIWLYGSSEADLTYTIVNARFGVMPAWGAFLTEDEVRAVSAYVHQLGGGEAEMPAE